MEETNTRGGDGRRLVLGFDAGCATCSGLATSIEEAVGDGLEIRSLNDPVMERWRDQALGENAPWAPTLIEARDGQVRAWTGVCIGVALGRRLGLPKTWRVLQVLGEVRSTAPAAISPWATDVLSRGQFVKRVAGAAVAMSILSATGAAPRSASAKDGWTHPLERVKYKSQKELHGAAKQRALQVAADSQDARNIWDGQMPPVDEAKAIKHDLDGGNTLTAVSWSADDKMVVHYAAEKPIGNYHTHAMLLAVVPGKEIRTVAESINGKDRMLLTAEGRIVETMRCACPIRSYRCVLNVVATICVACVATCASCRKKPSRSTCAACISCAFLGCPGAIRRCCIR